MHVVNVCSKVKTVEGILDVVMRQVFPIVLLFPTWVNLGNFVALWGPKLCLLLSRWVHQILCWAVAMPANANCAHGPRPEPTAEFVMLLCVTNDECNRKFHFDFMHFPIPWQVFEDSRFLALFFERSKSFIQTSVQVFNGMNWLHFLFCKCFHE